MERFDNNIFSSWRVSYGKRSQFKWLFVPGRDPHVWWMDCQPARDPFTTRDNGTTLHFRHDVSHRRLCSITLYLINTILYFITERLGEVKHCVKLKFSVTEEEVFGNVDEL